MWALLILDTAMQKTVRVCPRAGIRVGVGVYMDSTCLPNELASAHTFLFQSATCDSAIMMNSLMIFVSTDL